MSTTPFDFEKYRKERQERDAKIDVDNTAKAEELHKKLVEQGRYPSAKTGHKVTIRKPMKPQEKRAIRPPKPRE